MRCTALYLFPVAATLLTGCPGEIKEEDDTADTALPETSASGEGAAGEGAIDEINAGDVVLTITSSISLGREIQAQVTEEAEVAAARVGSCEPDVTVDGEQVDIDFTPCDEQGLAGELSCRDDETQDFVEGYSMNGLTVTGDVSLSKEDSVVTFMTEEGAPIVVSDGARSLSTAFELSGERDRSEHQTTMWGTATVTGDDGASTTTADVLLGGTSAETVTDSPLTFSTGDLCFCPSAGLLAVGSTYLVSSVVLDPDTFVDPTDGTDDFPEVNVDLPAELSSDVQVTTTFSETCGDLDMSVTASEVSATITWEEIGAAVCEQSCSGAWDSAAFTCSSADSACGRLANKLGRVANSGAEDPTVTLDGAGLADQVLSLVESKVSGERCTPGSLWSFVTGGSEG